MKRILVVILFIVFAIPFLGNFFKKNIGDIHPAILPQKEEVMKMRQSNNLSFSLPDKFEIIVFAENIDRVRDLEISPGGTVLATSLQMGSVVALPDKNGDGIADETKKIISGLSRPHGIAFFPSTDSTSSPQASSGQVKLFVTEETRVSRYSWDESTLNAQFEKKLFDLPKGGRHFTRTIDFDSKGNMYVSLGSTCDVCFEKQPWIAAIITSDAEGANPRLFAKGLRNSVFIAVNPKTDELWATEMGRDFLGDSLPPDEVNILRDGKDYGWPVCYGDKVFDQKFGQKTPQYCEGTEATVFDLPAHVAPLGLTFIDSPQFPREWQGDLLIAYHGSWNRSVPVGYKIVRLLVDGNNVTGAEDFITGFLKGDEAIARPVDLVFDKTGNLYISDDKAGVIYKVSSNK